METDGQILKASASILDDAADSAEPITRDFDIGTFIDTLQWGGGGIPLDWNPGKRLSDLIDGPYRDVRDRMIAAMSYATRVLRANADAVNETARNYMGTELANVERMQELHR